MVVSDMTLEVLKGVRSLIANPDNWCKYALANDADGRVVPFWRDDACKWCLIGATSKVIHSKIKDIVNLSEDWGHNYGVAEREAFHSLCRTDEVRSRYADLLDNISLNDFDRIVSRFNDYFDHGNVLTALDQAIKERDNHDY